MINELVKISYRYKLVSTDEEMSRDILNNLSDLNMTNILLDEKIDLDDPFYVSEIQKLELPPDFVEAVYCLSEQEFWDCYRYNTFKNYKRVSILKQYPRLPNPIPRILRIAGGIDYRNWIYNNRYHLLYISRIELLKNSPFMHTTEASQLIEKYKDKLEIMEYIDKQREEIQDREEDIQDKDIQDQTQTQEKDIQDQDIQSKYDKEDKQYERWLNRHKYRN